jgi:hypothetical protein
MGKSTGPYVVIAVFLISVIVYLISTATKPIVEISSDYINTVNETDVIPEDLVIHIEEKEEIIREYNICINKEMDIISKFIKNNNNRVPLLVADQIAYSTITRCKKENLPPGIIVGIMYVESTFDPYALGSPVGKQKRRARGLGQVLDNSCEGEKIDKDKLHNIDYNIEHTIKILLSKLKYAKGDIDKALYLYVGQDAVYASKVFKVMGEYRYFRSQRT